MTTIALTNDRINAQGGLHLIGKLIERHSGLRGAFGADTSKRSDRISDADILLSQIGLLVQGRTHYEDIELFRQPEQREAEHLAQCLGLARVPSEAILRQRLKKLASDGQVAVQLDADNLALQDQVLIRMDSGNDSADNIALLREGSQRFIIKRNPRQENPVKWLSHAMAQGQPERPRPGKEVYVGTAEHCRPGGESSEQEPLPVIYRVVRRSIDKHGQPLLIDDISVETYWTNLGESAADIIALYHDHGTSEQYHSELKSDLNLERFPSQSFAVNTLFLQLGAYAYNLLRSLDELARSVREEQAESWPRRIKAVARRRVGSIIRDIIHVACKWVRHSGREVLKLASHWPWSRVMLGIHARLSAA